MELCSLSDAAVGGEPDDPDGAGDGGGGSGGGGGGGDGGAPMIGYEAMVGYQLVLFHQGFLCQSSFVRDTAQQVEQDSPICLCSHHCVASAAVAIQPIAYPAAESAACWVAMFDGLRPTRHSMLTVPGMPGLQGGRRPVEQGVKLFFVDSSADRAQQLAAAVLQSLAANDERRLDAVLKATG